MFRGNLAHTGVYDGLGVPKLTGIKWKFHTDGLIISSPAVVNESVFFGSTDGNLYAIDRGSGASKWKFATKARVVSSPAIAGDTLFIGGWDSYFYAIDAASGKEKWRFKTGEDPDIHNQVGIQSSAAVVDGAVYFGCRDSNFYALDAVTGRKRWSFSNKGSWVVASPAVLNGRVYFATSDSELLHALDTKSGREIFSLKFHFPFFASPAIAGNTLYIGSHDGKLTAIDLKTQARSWEFQTDASRQKLAAFSKPDGSPNYEAVFRSSFYDDLVAGVVRMQSVGTILSSPVIAGGVVYFGSNDGNLYALR